MTTESISYASLNKVARLLHHNVYGNCICFYFLLNTITCIRTKWTNPNHPIVKFAISDDRVQFFHQDYFLHTSMPIHGQTQLLTCKA